MYQVVFPGMNLLNKQPILLLSNTLSATYQCGNCRFSDKNALFDVLDFSKTGIKKKLEETVSKFLIRKYGFLPQIQ